MDNLQPTPHIPQSRQPIAAIIVFWLGLGGLLLVDAYTPLSLWRETSYAVAAKLLINLLAAFWLFFDSQYRGWSAKRSLVYSGVTIFLLELSVPVYIWQSRGLRGGLATLLRFMLRLLALMAALAIVSGVPKVWEGLF